MGKIVLSYRREDAKTITNWLHEKLVDRYGRDAIFRDIDSIQPTENFKKRIGRALKDCDFVIAVIGPAWHGPNPGGQSRINSTNDWVRVEIETALQLDIPLLPVLVEDAEMPDPEILPASLREITEINALPVASGGARFHEDLNRLFTAIDKSIGNGPAAAPQAPPSPLPPDPKSPPIGETPRQPSQVSPTSVRPAPGRGPEPPPSRPDPPPPPPPRQAEVAPASGSLHTASTAGLWQGADTGGGPSTPTTTSRANRLFTGPTALTFVLIPAAILIALWYLGLWVLGLTPAFMMLFTGVFTALLGITISRFGGGSIVGALVSGAIVGAASLLPIASATAGGPRSDEWPVVILVLVGGGAITSAVGYLLAAAVGKARSR